jgi:hypothetical protein
MPALINGSAPAGNGAAGNRPELSNPMLQQIQDQIERNLAVDPANKQAFLKIVVAGQHFGLDKGAQGLLAQLHNSRDPIADAAKGAVSLALIMRKEAKSVMPLKAMVPAAAVLMLKALDFLDRSRVVKIGVPELTRASEIFGDFVLARFGISKQGLQHAAQKVHQIVSDPESMVKLQMKAGLLRHPDAATPTPGV